MINEIMAPTAKGNCPCCDAAADTFVLECEKCKQWIHFGVLQTPILHVNLIPQSSRAYSCSSCVHERFMIDFPGLYDTFDEVIIKQNTTLRAGVTADFSSQTDPPTSQRTEPTHTDSLSPHPYCQSLPPPSLSKPR